MENKNEDVVDISDIVETKDDDGNDTTDWKAIALERTELAKKNAGIAKRFKTKFEKAKEAVAEVPEKEAKSEKKEPTDLDYSQKAFLKASGINEFDLVKAELKNFPGTLDELIENPYFKQKLDTVRTEKANTDAASAGTNRTGAPQRNSVDYYLGKMKAGEDIPSDVPKELRLKIVEALRAKSTDKRMFYND